MRAYAAVLAAIALGGCADNLAELRTLAPVAEDFNSALASEYLAYAESEAEQGRAQAAQHFAGKGVAAAKGEIVTPDMPYESDGKLVSAREALLALSTDDIKNVNPQLLARAQLLYDCWLAQHRAVISGMPAACADEFQSALDDVQRVADLFVYGKEVTHQLKFTSGSSALSSSAKAKIKEIAGRMKRVVSYAIELRAGEAGVNRAPSSLSAERVAMVRAAFAAHGIPPERVIEKHPAEGAAVLLSSDVEEVNTVEVTVRTLAASNVTPGGR